MKTVRSFFILHLVLCLFIFLNIDEIKSQPFWEWETKTPLTDSVSDNMNPHLLLIYNGSEPMMNMVWENSTDVNSTAIYYRNLLGTDESQVMISQPGVHFTHPKIMEIFDSFDYYFYVFFQSDQDGDQDIYYMKYGIDGQFTGPFPFATGEFDQDNFMPENNSMFGKSVQERFIVNALAWTSNGMLMTCDLEKNGDVFSFSDPIMVDPGNCSDPVIVSDQQIYYIREEEENRFIYSVYRQAPPGNWSSPDLYFGEGNCYNLAEDNVTPQFITWSADSNEVFRNYLANSYNEFNGYAIGPGSANPLDPAVCTLVLAVEPKDDPFFGYYMAFPFEENGYDEIFLNDGWGPYFLNFTQAGADNSNPDFFTGEITPWNVDCFYVYLVWEEWQNEHWQIFTSQTVMCVGGVEENEENHESVNVFPNPFRGEINLSFKLSSDNFVKIDMVDIFGRKIWEVYSGSLDAGDQQFTWKGIDNAGRLVPPGIYFLKLNAGSIKTSIKVLKLD